MQSTIHETMKSGRKPCCLGVRAVAKDQWRRIRGSSNDPYAVVQLLPGNYTNGKKNLQKKTKTNDKKKEPTKKKTKIK